METGLGLAAAVLGVEAWLTKKAVLFDGALETVGGTLLAGRSNLNELLWTLALHNCNDK